MAAAPALKIYTESGSYVGAAKEVYGAAAMLGFYGDGATIRLGHSKSDIVYTQGADGDATESYDQTALLILSRIPASQHYLIRY